MDKREDKKKKSTHIEFDLEQELSAEELAKFKSNAGSKELTEHFLDITVRKAEPAA